MLLAGCIVGYEPTGQSNHDQLDGDGPSAGKLLYDRFNTFDVWHGDDVLGSVLVTEAVSERSPRPDAEDWRWDPEQVLDLRQGAMTELEFTLRQHGEQDDKEAMHEAFYSRTESWDQWACSRDFSFGEAIEGRSTDIEKGVLVYRMEPIDRSERRWHLLEIRFGADGVPQVYFSLDLDQVEAYESAAGHGLRKAEAQVPVSPSALKLIPPTEQVKVIALKPLWADD